MLSTGFVVGRVVAQRPFAEARVDRFSATAPYRQRINTDLTLQAGVRFGSSG